MASNLNAYVTFPNMAKAAMEFYRSVLGGELAINTFGEFGADAENPDGIMHAALETPDGFRLMASDTAPGHPVTVGDNISLSLSGDDSDKLRGWFNGLAEGGTVDMPLEKQMWGDEFGMLTDRFGIHWMVNIVSQSS